MSTYLDSLDAARGVFVGGTFRPGGAGVFDVENPADRTVVAQVADGDTADATVAVDAANAALASWRLTPDRERSEMLHRTFELMMRDQHELAELIVDENGKSRTDAHAEVAYAAEFFRWFAEEAVRSGGDYGASPTGGVRMVVTHRPVGVAALVTPWNFPAAMATRKIAPALAAGCTVVLKPASETPLTAIALTRLLVEAGVPRGVVNVVPTTDAAGVVTAWLEDPRVRKISFTGSNRIGQVLLRQAADRVVNSSMELGGNAPFVVTEDADLDAAVTGAMVAKFRNGGQACTAANRFYIHAGVVDEFTTRFGAAVEALTVGAAADGAEIGPPDLLARRAGRRRARAAGHRGGSAHQPSRAGAQQQGLVLPADRAGRRPRRRRHPRRRDLRSRRSDRGVARRQRAAQARQRLRDGACRLRIRR